MPLPYVNSFYTIIVGVEFAINSYEIEHLSTKWPSVSSLILKCNSVDARIWVQKFGRKLATLRIDKVSHWQEIPVYCPDLRHLYLGQVGLYGEVADSFWNAVGKNLETLSINCITTEFINQVDLIKKHRRKIKRLLVSGAGA